MVCSVLREKMRHPGIEPGALRWQRSILPLNQWRFWMNNGSKRVAKGGFDPPTFGL